LKDQEIAYMGRVTAGMTHEFKNVLAIIRESSGLLEDLLTIGQARSFPQREKFLKVLGTIQEQVQRGVDLATHLNRFAHSMDEPWAAVELNEVLGHTLHLLERFARIKKVQLRLVRDSEELIVNTDPFRVRMAVSLCIDSLLETSGEGGEIVIRPRWEEGGEAVLISIQRSGASAETWGGIPADAAGVPGHVLEGLRLQIHALDDPAGVGFVLRIPRGHG
jgi:signal transduction histidine kinase